MFTLLARRVRDAWKRVSSGVRPEPVLLLYTPGGSDSDLPATFGATAGRVERCSDPESVRRLRLEVDLILVDLTRDPDGGLEMIEMLGRHAPGCPIVGVVEGLDPFLESHAMEAGCVGYVRAAASPRSLGAALFDYLHANARAIPGSPIPPASAPVPRAPRLRTSVRFGEWDGGRDGEARAQPGEGTWG